MMSLQTIGPQSLRDLLRYWRRQRGKSQMDLALAAGVSQRHISFIEMGRSVASRDLLLTLARALDIPLRERNQLLLAGGYAPVYLEIAWDEPEMAFVSRAIDRMLEKQEPYPALVRDRYWNVLKTNRAMECFWGEYIDLSKQEKPYNLLRIIFSPEGLRPFFVDWQSAASALLQWVRRDNVGHEFDEKMTTLLAQLESYPGLEELYGPYKQEGPVIPFTFCRGNQLRSYFVLTTTVGTPLSITTQELRIDTVFPMNED